MLDSFLIYCPFSFISLSLSLAPPLLDLYLDFFLFILMADYCFVYLSFRMSVAITLLQPSNCQRCSDFISKSEIDIDFILKKMNEWMKHNSKDGRPSCIVSGRLRAWFEDKLNNSILFITIYRYVKKITNNRPTKYSTAAKTLSIINWGNQFPICDFSLFSPFEIVSPFCLFFLLNYCDLINKIINY